MRTYKITENEKPIAIYAITAYMGIGIFDIKYETDEYVKTAYIMGEERTSFVWSKIRYTQFGRPYFIRLGEHYYFADMIKTC